MGYEHMFGPLEAIAKLRKELDAARSRVAEEVADYDRSDDWLAEGYVSAANALRYACRMNRGSARSRQARPQAGRPHGGGRRVRCRRDLRSARAGRYEHVHAERAAELDGLETALVGAAFLVATPTELANVVRHAPTRSTVAGAPP